MKKGFPVQVDTTSDQEIEQEWSPDQPLRSRHNKEDQFEPGTARESNTVPTSENKQGQATRIPEEEVVNNKMARKGTEERIPTDLSPWMS
ncbi:hypothetical protein TNCV_504641 [Trichonephila clavipes]|nr:hypothetical protein TNCV_504641 [Trichonephila clavipes]